MVYVALMDEAGTILNKMDAWCCNADLRMVDWAERHGYRVVKSEITFMGDMVIWVE